MNIFNFFPLGVSKLTKDCTWSKIADQVSVIGSVRTVQQCKKKRSDQKSESETKAAHISSSLYKTGGGKGSDKKLNSIDQVLVNKIPKVFKNFMLLHLPFLLSKVGFGRIVTNETNDFF